MVITVLLTWAPAGLVKEYRCMGCGDVYRMTPSAFGVSSCDDPSL